jgi:PPOX class probable F420-dependent enzyme
MATIPDDYRDLLTGTNFAHLVTLMPDGSPQTTPVWVDVDGADVIVNTAAGRQKARNMERDPRVAISIHDASNPYRYIQIRGKVAEMTAEGADENIDALAKKYLGQDTYPFRTPDEKRLIARIQPEHVQTYG